MGSFILREVAGLPFHLITTNTSGAERATIGRIIQGGNSGTEGEGDKVSEGVVAGEVGVADETWVGEGDGVMRGSGAAA